MLCNMTWLRGLGHSLLALRKVWKKGRVNRNVGCVCQGYTVDLEEFSSVVVELEVKKARQQRHQNRPCDEDRTAQITPCSLPRHIYFNKGRTFRVLFETPPPLQTKYSNPDDNPNSQERSFGYLNKFRDLKYGKSCGTDSATRAPQI